jgi:hypothetical protein
MSHREGMEDACYTDLTTRMQIQLASCFQILPKNGAYDTDWRTLLRRNYECLRQLQFSNGREGYGGRSSRC